jgi:hypothetical protein
VNNALSKKTLPGQELGWRLQVCCSSTRDRQKDPPATPARNIKMTSAHRSIVRLLAELAVKEWLQTTSSEKPTDPTEHESHHLRPLQHRQAKRIVN